MPKLLAFLPCDNVLISGGEAQSASLIVVLTQITFPVALPTNLPPNAAVPLRWFYFTQWEIDESEVGIEYEQRIHMDGLDGKRLIESTLRFIGAAEKPIHRTMVLNLGFPIVPTGKYRLRLSIKATNEDEWTEAGDYPLAVIHAEGAQSVSAAALENKE